MWLLQWHLNFTSSGQNSWFCFFTMNSTHFFPSQKMAPLFTQLFNSKTNKSFPIPLSFTPISHLRAAKMHPPSLTSHAVILAQASITFRLDHCWIQPPNRNPCVPHHSTGHIFHPPLVVESISPLVTPKSHHVPSQPKLQCSLNLLE